MQEIIGVTIGDPAGIGPEIILKSFPLLRRVRKAIPLIIGDLPVLQRAGRILNLKVPLREIESIAEVKPDYLNIFSPAVIRSENYPVGKNSALCGRASFRYVEEAVSLWRQGWISGLVTLPISKKAWHMAGKKYEGHTELLKDLAGAKQATMIMIAGHIRLLLVTTHIPLKEVFSRLSIRAIVEKTEIGRRFLAGLGISKPRIGISALNPHAGEEGVLGNEEERIIKPAVLKLRQEGIDCSGPWPADVIFRLAREKKLDLIVSLYHDQALIPLKTFYFEKLVNFTFGLPFVRTSPGHGTGFDIAYQNKANPNSFLSAYRFVNK